MLFLKAKSKVIFVDFFQMADLLIQEGALRGT